MRILSFGAYTGYHSLLCKYAMPVLSLSSRRSVFSVLPSVVVDAMAPLKEAALHRGFTPLFPETPVTPSDKKSRPKHTRAYTTARFAAASWEADFLAEAGGGKVRSYLGWTYEELCLEADRIPAFLFRNATPDSLITSLYTNNARARIDSLLATASIFFGVTLSAGGFSEKSALLRAADPLFWRRVLWKRAVQARESLHLRLKLVGDPSKTSGKSAYVSAAGLGTRRAQLQRIERYLAMTVLKTKLPGDVEFAVPLSAVAKTAKQKMARVYSFVQALDAIAVDASLEVSMITVTLPGEYHANPNRSLRHRWNGSTPEMSHKEIGRRWQDIRRDLSDKGVYLSGFWAGEPHKDGTPHRHFWCIYRPEHRALIMSIFARYFPMQIVRKTEVPSIRLRDPILGDLAYLDEAACLSGTCTEMQKKAPACVEFSVVDRNLGSGASYAYKYLFPDLTSETGAAVDAHRSIWKIRSHQFFGVKGSLTLWDELRKIDKTPHEPTMHALWVAARGGVKTGRTGLNEQRGDARRYIELQGGLACLSSVPAAVIVRVATRTAESWYGEPSRRITGVESVSFYFEKVRRDHINRETGVIGYRTRKVRKVQPLAFVSTRKFVWARVIVDPAPLRPLINEFISRAVLAGHIPPNSDAERAALASRAL